MCHLCDADWRLLPYAMLLELSLQLGRKEKFHGLVRVQVLHFLVRAGMEATHSPWLPWNQLRSRRLFIETIIIIICRALGSVAMFVVLQWHFISKGDELMSEIAPQLAYGCEGKASCMRYFNFTMLIFSSSVLVLLTAILGIRSDFRFKRIIAHSQRIKDSANRSIVSRLSYFKQMNVMLTTVLFLHGASFVILCVDGFTDSMTINTNKFACDLLIANINMCVVCLWLLFVSRTRRTAETPPPFLTHLRLSDFYFPSSSQLRWTRPDIPCITDGSGYRIYFEERCGGEPAKQPTN